MAAPRILIIRYSAIGDCVMAAWAASAVRNRYPDAFLCWAVETRCAPMIDRNSLATRVEEIPRERWKRARWSPRTWQEQLTKHARLRGLRFDIGFDLQGYSKTAFCLRLANPKQRVAAYAKDALAARLNPVAGPQPAGLHTVEWYGRVLQTVGDYTIPERPIMPSDLEASKNLIQQVGGDQPLATITVSAGHPTKAYYAEGWVEVAQGLMARGYRVAFLGGPSDAPIELPGTVDWVRKLPLATTLEAVRLSSIHISADTGNAHMAAAVGVPTVSVFGPTDPVLYRPFNKNGCVLRKGEQTSLVTPSEILGATQEIMGR